jgi:uncharacterized membrane protein
VQSGSASAAPSAPDFARAQAIVQARCVSCHAEHPNNPYGFSTAPLGAMLDTPERLIALLPKVRAQVSAKTMPIGNLTQMTEEERSELLAWIDAGAPH